MRYDVDIENDDEIVKQWLIGCLDNKYTPAEFLSAIAVLLRYVTTEEEFEKLTVDNPLCRV